MREIYRKREVQLNPEAFRGWEESFRTEVNEKQYWERMIEFLSVNKELDDDSGRCLLKFINSEEAEFLFNKEILSQDEKQKRTIELLQRLNMLKIRREEGYNVINEYGTEDFVQQYQKLKRIYGGNEEIYKEEFYKKAPKYIIFYYIFAKKYKGISDKFEKRVCYQRYGKITPYGNYYNKSAIRDLVISNMNRVPLYKKTPKNLCDKAKYKYREDGALLMFQWYDEEEREYLREVYFQSENFIYSFAYDRNDRLEEIGIRKYENEKIVYSEYGRIHEWDSILCSEIHSEKYKYFNDKLCDAFLEEYHFPMYSKSSIKQLSDILIRQQYIFESDEKGYLKGYFLKEWWGDKIKENSWESVLLLLSEKKQKDTSKDAGRWRRPNYFIE